MAAPFLLGCLCCRFKPFCSHCIESPAMRASAVDWPGLSFRAQWSVEALPRLLVKPFILVCMHAFLSPLFPGPRRRTGRVG